MEASKESPRENLEVGFRPHVASPTLVESVVVILILLSGCTCFGSCDDCNQ